MGSGGSGSGAGASLLAVQKPVNLPVCFTICSACLPLPACRFFIFVFGLYQSSDGELDDEFILALSQSKSGAYLSACLRALE